MKMFILGMIMMAWLCTGLFSAFFDEKYDCINVPMILFMAFVPFIPWVAHWCGLF